VKSRLLEFIDENHRDEDRPREVIGWGNGIPRRASVSKGQRQTSKSMSFHQTLLRLIENLRAIQRFHRSDTSSDFDQLMLSAIQPFSIQNDPPISQLFNPYFFDQKYHLSKVMSPIDHCVGNILTEFGFVEFLL
jgi:hypothetical protein